MTRPTRPPAARARNDSRSTCSRARAGWSDPAAPGGADPADPDLPADLPGRGLAAGPRSGQPVHQLGRPAGGLRGPHLLRTRVAEWWMRHFIVTKRRVLLTSGLIVRTVTLLPLRRITDLTWQETLGGQLLGYGTFKFESAGQDQALRHLTYVPNAQQVYQDISGLLFGKDYPGPASGGDESGTTSGRHRRPRSLGTPRERPQRHRADRRSPAAPGVSPPPSRSGRVPIRSVRQAERRCGSTCTPTPPSPTAPRAPPSCSRPPRPRASTSSRSPTTTRPPAGRPPRRRGRAG